MSKNFGCQSMVDPIKRVLIKHPREAYQAQSKVDQQAPQLNYFGTPNFEKAISDYDKFVGLLESCDIEIHFLPENDTTSLDSVYTHDPCVISNDGVILCTMGKEARVPESKAVEAYFESIGVPILGRIESPGTLEGGDVVWIDERTVAVGEGYRSNAEGIRQFKEILGDHMNDVISVPLPHWTGPADCLHLMSNISPIDHGLYLVYSRLLPVPFREYLIERGIKLIEVPDDEYNSMGCNVLAVAPRKVIMIDGNSITKQRLEAEGVDIHSYDGSEISIKGAGGPTCLTRPFLRSAQ
jgi:N-dimethylarginine dimethylaminohydrolase